MRLVFLLLAVGLSVCVVAGQENAESTQGPSYVAAVEALQNGDAATASDQLAQHVAASPSAVAYYNLALAYQQQNQVALANWAALSSDALGGTKQTQAMLSSLQRKVPIELRPLSRGPLLTGWRWLASQLSANGWAGAAGVLMLFASVLLVLSLLGRPFSVSVFLIACLAIVVFALGKTTGSFLDDPRAVVVSNSALYVSPSAQSERVRTLPTSTILSLGESLNDFYAVQIPTGEQGWVPSSAVRRVLSKD